VPTLDKVGTKNCELKILRSKHISAQMTLFFTELDRTGRWSTGEIDGKVFVNGNPNDCESVDDMKRAHKVKLTRDGLLTIPMDPLEYGHICSHCDLSSSNHVNISPARLAQFAAMMMATFLMTRFDEVIKSPFARAASSVGAS